MPPQLIIQDVSLCAIVRDEIMNPAGGIVDFVDSTLPFLETGVIIDTGSLDGTRQALEELKAKHTNLFVYDHKFNGYGPSRNVSLERTKTKYALVLDADERLTPWDFSEIRLFLEYYPRLCYEFGFQHIHPDGRNVEAYNHTYRLFEASKFRFKRNLWECLSPAPKEGEYLELPIKIKHFLPEVIGTLLKITQWNNHIVNESELNPQIGAPSQTKNFEIWKLYNLGWKPYYSRY